MKRFFYIVLLVTLTLGAKAQNQFHMGQYMIHQPFINPASIGSYDDLNAALLYKKQWAGFEGAPKVQGLNLNLPLPGEKSFLGLTVLRDEIGITTSTEVTGSYAYRLKTGLNSKLTFGLSASLNMMQSNLDDLHIHDIDDPLFSENTPTYLMPNFEFGTYFTAKRFYVGLAIPNLLENKIIFTDGLEGATSFNFQNLHYYLHSGYAWKLNEKDDLNTSVLIKEVAGASLQFDVNMQVMFDNKFGIGASYRSSKELLAMLTFNVIPQLRLSYGYEFNFAELGNYSNGSHEVLLIFNRVKADKPVIAIPRF
jgi:type IX secretion system PorP/SprF family membrane protein